jgi:hypothetical protein
MAMLVVSGWHIGALVICAFLLGAGLVWTLTDIRLTGNVVAETQSSYTWTTAICNAQRACIDVLVTCVQGKVTSLTPVSNLTSFADTWEDPRSERVDLCV